MKKNPAQKSFKIKSFLAVRFTPRTKELYFWGITPKPKSGVL
jgi:hypothetical protein